MVAHEVKWVDSSQFPGTKSAIHCWKASKATRPPIFIVHGIGEHAFRYQEVAEFFCSKGHDVFAPDLPGHGLSKKDGLQKRCFAIEEMARVCETLRTALFGSAPWYLLSHSMGSLIAMVWLLECKKQPLAAFVSAPPLALRLQVPAWKEFASKVLLRLSPDLQLTNEIDPQMLSYDPENIKRYRDDKLVHPYSTAKQYDSIKRGAFQVLNQAKAFRVPLFLAVGDDDPIVEPQAILGFSEAVTCPVQVKVIAKAKHEILNETQRHTLFGDVDGWFARYT